MEKSDLRKYVCVCRLLDSFTNLYAWSWNRLSLSQIFSFYVRPFLWLTLIHHDILYHTLIPYFPVTARTNGVPFVSSAQASLCLSHRKEVGKREEKARKRRWEERRTPPLLFFSYFYSRWNTQREPLWRREVFHCILHLSLCLHYRIAFAPPQKSYRVGLLFTHKNGCDGAISLTEPSCAAPISKVDHHISDRVSVLLWSSVNTDLFGPSRK